MRIVGGRHRGRSLATPVGGDIRPTSDRSREAIFNILAHGDAYRTEHGALPAGVNVVDAFAGTGAMGLEALSRGAAHVTFIDNDRTAQALLRQNIAALKETENATVLARDATAPGLARAPCHLALLDPPYRSDLAGLALTALARDGWLAPDAVAVIELPAKGGFEPPAGFDVQDRRKYGRAQILFLVWQG